MAKAQQYRVDPNMAGVDLPNISTQGVQQGMTVPGNMNAVYAMRRLLRMQAAAGRQVPGRVMPPPKPQPLKKF